MPRSHSTATVDRSKAASTQGILRIGFGVATAFVVCETIGWYPTFLAPILAAVLLSSLPAPLGIKPGILLVFVQAAGAYTAFALSMLMRDVPFVLFGAIAIIIFLSFAVIASGRGFLPILLVLISFSTIPIVTMVAPEQANVLPLAFTRGMAIAVVVVWVAHAIWPNMPPKAAGPSPARIADPLALALLGSAIVLPLMLVYLMFGITEALPVLITTVVLVVNFDGQRGAAQGIAMMTGNFVGGLVALLCYLLLQIAPSVLVLTVITLLMALMFAQRIQRGGPGGSVALITLNQALVMFSLSLVPGPSSPGLWASRLLQFGVACAFGVAMMYLLFPASTPRERAHI